MAAPEIKCVENYLELYEFVAESLVKTLLNLLDSSEIFKEINARNALLELERELAQESNAYAIEQQAIAIGKLYKKLKQELEKAGLPLIKLNAENLKGETNETLSLGRNSFDSKSPPTVRDILIYTYQIPIDIVNIFGEMIEKYGYNFSGSNFSGAELRWAKLSGVKGERANFSRANLYGAELYWAKLSGADFSGADLKLTKLCRAKLYRANLSGADLYMANLSDADLRGAKFDKETILPNNLNTNSPLFPFSNKQINQLSESEKTKAIAFNDKFKKEKRTKILGMEIIGSGVFQVSRKNVLAEQPPSTRVAGIVCQMFKSAIAYGI